MVMCINAIHQNLGLVGFCIPEIALHVILLAAMELRHFSETDVFHDTGVKAQDEPTRFRIWSRRGLDLVKMFETEILPKLSDLRFGRHHINNR